MPMARCKFVVMTTNTNGENLSSGVTFTSKDSGDNQKQITFSKNLPSGATAGKKLLIATQSFAALGLVTPDFLIPDQFIPTGKGSVGDPFSVLAWGGSELPTDGVNALYLKNFVTSVSANRANEFRRAERVGIVAATTTHRCKLSGPVVGRAGGKWLGHQLRAPGQRHFRGRGSPTTPPAKAGG